MAQADADQSLGRQTWRRLRIILPAMVFCRGIVLLCVLPPFEGWDEYQHVAYLVHLNEMGERPWFGENDVPKSLMVQLPHFPHPQSALQQIGTNGLGYQQYWANQGEGRVVQSSAGAPARIGLYQAQHGPFFYRLVAPLFTRLGGVGDLRQSIAGVRLVNLLLTVGAVWVALGIIFRHVDNPLVGIFCGLLISIHPLFLMNGVRVANDALGVLLATIAIGWALDLRQILPSSRANASSFGIGLVAGLAVLAKSVHFGLVPFIGAAWLWAIVSNSRTGRSPVTMRRAAASTLAMAIGFLVTTQAEFRANLARYGSVTVMQEALINRQAGHKVGALIAAGRAVSWHSFVEKLWLRKNVMSGGWSWAGANTKIQDRHEILALIAIFGWAWRLSPTRRARLSPLFRDPGLPLLCLAVCFGYTASLSYHVIQSQLCWGTPSTNPWYAAAAYPWFLLVVTGGALAWPVGRLRIVLPVAMFLFFLETQTTIVLGSMISTYTAGANWGEALQRLAFLQPPFLGTATFYMAVGAVVILASMALAEALRVAREVANIYRFHRGPHTASTISIRSHANATARAS